MGGVLHVGFLDRGAQRTFVVRGQAKAVADVVVDGVVRVVDGERQVGGRGLRGRQTGKHGDERNAKTDQPEKLFHHVPFLLVQVVKISATPQGACILARNVRLSYH